jgi:hypothetical protein
MEMSYIYGIPMIRAEPSVPLEWELVEVMIGGLGEGYLQHCLFT